MRSLSDSVLASMMSESADIVAVWTMTIEHENLLDVAGSAILRVVNNPEDINVSGTTYTACGFDIKLAPDTEKTVRPASIIIDNTDQWMVPIVRSLTTAPDITLAFVSATDLSADPPEFDTVEIQTLPLKLINTTLTREIAKGQLAIVHPLQRKWPRPNMIQSLFQGMY